MHTKKLTLIIMDGWGIGDHSMADAIFNAHTPFFDELCVKYPCSRLVTSGEDVGLPQGQMGNSEVGHLNIGAGRVVYQDLVKINVAIRDKSFFSNPILWQALKHAKENNKNVHLIGLVSDGGVHSHITHLYALCDLTHQMGLSNVFIHAFTDGRDTDPKSGLKFITELESHLKHSTAQIASLVGRYYAMDRDKRWERVKIAYDLLVHGIGKKTKNIKQAIEESYQRNETDEFIKPIVKTDEKGNPIACIQDGDVVICFNFRTDRCREISMALTQMDFVEHQMKKLDLYYVTMANYDHTFKNVKIVFEKDNLPMTLGEVLFKNKKAQLRIAETEKYPHVTFFFSGGREEIFEGESRIMIPSPKVATYDLKPSMSAFEVAEAAVQFMKEKQPDFVCLNFANPDMVGHTGVYEAVIEAVETTDKCVQKVVEAGLKLNYSFLIIADHGNADYMINTDGSPNTAHTTNPVPCILIDKDYHQIKNGRLADIAPTILKLMDIQKPDEMSGEALV
jgi:2,3-bisphosphoglycerate-independent phosphoglycerate mutase